MRGDSLSTAPFCLSIGSRRWHRRRSEEHTSELQSHHDLVCRLLLEKKKERYSFFFYIRIKFLCIFVFLLYHFVSFPTFLLSCVEVFCLFLFFFFTDPASSGFYTLSLHDALPILFFNLEER